MMGRPLRVAACLATLVLAGCRGPASGPPPKPAPAAAPSLGLPLRSEPGPPLPEAITNNAVASLTIDGKARLFSFMGLGPARDYAAITRHAYVFEEEKDGWSALPDVPGAVGRIAATAQAAGDRVYLLGGYSVAKDGKETTSPTLDIFDVRRSRYSRGTDIPVPVDDSVSGLWRDSLIYLVGGWSVSNNVAAVQIYDPAHDTWAAASPIVGAPVFGHSGGIVRDVIVYCGGARVQASGTPRYVVNEECYRGDINAREPTSVLWRRIANHPGPARYRAAAGPVETGGLTGILFAGGTSNPYNYNGVGYDGRPSEPETTSWIYDIERDAWVEGPRVVPSSMDHRGLVFAGGAWWTIGGMGPGQQVRASVTRLVIAHP